MNILSFHGLWHPLDGMDGWGNINHNGSQARNYHKIVYLSANDYYACGDCVACMSEEDKPQHNDYRAWLQGSPGVAW